MVQASKFHKGDTWGDDTVVEQSSTNQEGETVSLYKKKDGKFQIGCGNKILVPFQAYAKLGLPWALYEACCEEYGCSPYPEAEIYYRRRGKLC